MSAVDVNRTESVELTGIQYIPRLRKMRDNHDI